MTCPLSADQCRGYDLLQEGVWITDADDRFVYLNPAMLSLAGVSREQVQGNVLLDLPEATIGEFRLFYLAARETGMPMPYECAVTTPEGRPSWQAGWLTPLRNAGRHAGMLCTVMDVSAKMALKTSMHSARQQLELILAGSDLGSWDWHVPSGHVSFNARWCEMLGYRHDEIAPHVSSWEKLVHPDDWPAISALVEAHLHGETASYESEHRLRHKHGHWVWVLDRGKVVERDAQGQPLRAAGTHLDISDRKRLKHEGTALLRRIEALITEATLTIPSGNTATSPQLTARQRRVLGLIAQGLTSTQIAAQLHISTATALTHRRDLMRKLGLHSTASLTRYAIEQGLDQ